MSSWIHTTASLDVSEDNEQYENLGISLEKTEELHPVLFSFDAEEVDMFRESYKYKDSSVISLKKMRCYWVIDMSYQELKSLVDRDPSLTKEQLFTQTRAEGEK